MSKNKSKRDTISEEEFNAQMTATPSSPEMDSPGDQEEDAGAEFLTGLNYMPDEKKEKDQEPGEMVFSESRGKSKKRNLKDRQIPDNSKLVSSDLPSPWEDMDTNSDTH